MSDITSYFLNSWYCSPVTINALVMPQLCTTVVSVLRTTHFNVKCRKFQAVDLWQLPWLNNAFYSCLTIKTIYLNASIWLTYCECWINRQTHSEKPTFFSNQMCSYTCLLISAFYFKSKRQLVLTNTRYSYRDWDANSTGKIFILSSPRKACKWFRNTIWRCLCANI